MPDLLREQFPFFRPIVEAFGYRNLEFEGWEADDVIATLATRADEAGIKTCVVSTDRDAFQLVTDNVTLMMTPRGVADVNVYTPERVEARLGITADKVPDFIGLKGDTSDNIAGVPGIGDKTASQLIAAVRLARGRARARRRADPGAPQGARRARRPGAQLEGARDDAPRPRHRLRPGRARARAARPLRSSRRCSAASSSARCCSASTSSTRPSRPRPRGRSRAKRCPGARPTTQVTQCYKVRRVGFAADESRVAVATDEGVVVGPRPSNTVLQGSDGRGSRRQGAAGRARRRHAARRLPDRAGAGDLRARRPRARVRRRRPRPSPRPTRRRPRSSAGRRCRRGSSRRCARACSSAGTSSSTRRSSCR